ncbi:MAG TPA: lysylphosphatidylglycerol synthase transmembrane domain-containing protein, partial [Thermoanaerobaculia bacterium]|nr:lysylphosphatidylglycerol synthase transmembrane domain-containing protein [Thermoanaerobaculia bacterium]
MRKLLRVLLIAAVTVLLLALFLRNSDPEAVLQVIRSTSVPWLLAALVTNFGALLFRTARWRAILTASTGAAPPLYDTFLSTAIGFFSSAVLPIRAGDVVRPALLSRRTGIRFANALATVVSERLIDLMAVLSMVVAFSLTEGRSLSANPVTARKALLIHSGATMAGIALATVIAFLVIL